MTNKEKAVKLAEESIKRFGFVVVSFNPGTVERNIGVPTTLLWEEFEMPQPFVPIRKATDSEWEEQKALAHCIFGRKPDFSKPGVPVILITD